MPNNWEHIDAKYDFWSGRKNPYKNSKISILMGSKYIEKFKNSVNGLKKTCSNLDQVELLVKVDGEGAIDDYRKFLMDSPFRFMLLCYPRYRGYFDYHTYINDLSKLAEGDLLWCMSDDIVITQGDWFKTLMNTRNKFTDNKYVVCMRELPRRKTANPCPAISREWFKFFNFFSPVSNIDTFVSRLAFLVNRYITVPEDSAPIMTHEGPHGYLGKEKFTSLNKKREHVEELCQRFADVFRKGIK